MNKKRALSKLIVLAFLLVSGLSASLSQAEIAVIVHPMNMSTIELPDIRRYFLGKRKRYTNGLVVVPLDQSHSSSEKKEFVETVLSKSQVQLKTYWAELLFTGKGTPPIEKESSEEVIQEVATNRSAIGYIDASEVKGEVRIVLIF